MCGEVIRWEGSILIIMEFLFELLLLDRILINVGFLGI